MHELTHWTGPRLKREYGSFGDKKYAFEELIAELGAAYLCAEAGLGYQTQHAAYIQDWIKLLESDKRAFFRASSKAQSAVDYILGTKEAV